MVINVQNSETLTVKERIFLDTFLKTFCQKTAYQAVKDVSDETAYKMGSRYMNRIRRKLSTLDWQGKREAHNLGEDRLLAELDGAFLEADKEDDQKARTELIRILSDILGKRKRTFEIDEMSSRLADWDFSAN